MFIVLLFYCFFSVPIFPLVSSPVAHSSFSPRSVGNWPLYWDTSYSSLLCYLILWCKFVCYAIFEALVFFHIFPWNSSSVICFFSIPAGFESVTLLLRKCYFYSVLCLMLWWRVVCGMQCLKPRHTFLISFHIVHPLTCSLSFPLAQESDPLLPCLCGALLIVVFKVLAWRFSSITDSLLKLSIKWGNTLFCLFRLGCL